MTAKFYKTRDAATSALRKLGVNVRDYNLFISKDDTGTILIVDLELAKAHVEKVEAQASALVEPKQTDKKHNGAKPAPAEKKDRSGTCSAVARDLIRAGKTNQEVWDIISVQFQLDDKKRLYPAWYRRELRNKGEKV